METEPYVVLLGYCLESWKNQKCITKITK